jgi:hypothetical protein
VTAPELVPAVATPSADMPSFDAAVQAFAARGWTLARTAAENGVPEFWAMRWGIGVHLGDAEAVAGFARRIGVTL